MAISNTDKAMDLAVNYLSFKSRTTSEMMTYLRKKDVDEAVIKHVLEKLMEYRYIDDEVYLKNYISNNSHLSRYGSKRLIQDLKRRGISDDLLLALEDLFPREEEHSCCQAVAEKTLKALSGQTVSQKRKKIYDKLGRMGYPSDMVLEMLRSLMLEEEPQELTVDEIAYEETKTWEKLDLDYNKYKRNHEKKGCSGKELDYRITKSLMGRGYPYEMIKAKIADESEKNN